MDDGGGIFEKKTLIANASTEEPKGLDFNT